MKVIMKNVFEKPVVLLFLILTCLIPLSPFIQACTPDPTDCSCEKSAVDAAAAAMKTAEDELGVAKAGMNAALAAIPGLTQAVTNSYNAYLLACLNLDAQKDSLNAAEQAFSALAIGSVLIDETPAALAVLAAVIAAKNKIDAEKKKLSIDEAAVANSSAIYSGAQAALATGQAAVLNTMDAFSSAIDNLSDATTALANAEAAYNSCVSS